MFVEPTGVHETTFRFGNSNPAVSFLDGEYVLRTKRFLELEESF